MSWIDDHRELYLKDPDKGHLWDGRPNGGPENTPTLLLTTVGRKSGEKRVMPLIYGHTAHGFVVVASKGGAPQNPDWYFNLEANPKVHVQVIHEQLEADAETVTGPARKELWDKMVEIWPPYADYQKKTEREIPVVLLRARK